MSDFNPNEYWESRLNNNFNLNGVGDIGLGVKYNEALYNVREFAFKQIMRHLKLDYSELEIMDVGSGTGFYIELWNHMGVKSILGTDITEVVIKHLTKKYHFANFKLLDIGEDRIEGIPKVDFISAFDVLFHIVDDSRFNQAIKNIHQLLKKGGYFVISDNFVHSEAIRGRHQVSRNYDYMINTIESIGFEFVKSKPMFVLMNTPIDSKNKYLKKFNQILDKVIKKGEFYGSLVGNMLKPFEKLLILAKEEGPSTEIKVFKKI